MPGAYTATPIVTTPPDVPDGWDPDWDFPGVSPPGYEPEYSLGTTAASTIAPGGSAVGAVVLYDHDTYATNEPEESQVLWTATLDGVQLDLRLAGGDSFSSSVLTNYAEVDEFWGSGTTFEFDITDDDTGKTITLASSSIVFEDYPVGSTADIDVVGEIARVVFSGTFTGTRFDPAPPFPDAGWNLNAEAEHTIGVTSGIVGGFWPIAGPPFTFGDFTSIPKAYATGLYSALGAQYGGSASWSSDPPVTATQDDNGGAGPCSYEVTLEVEENYAYAFYMQVSEIRGWANGTWSLIFYDDGDNIVEEYSGVYDITDDTGSPAAYPIYYFDTRDGTVHEA